MASPEDGEDFCCGFSVEEGEEERPGRDERARLIQKLEDEMTRERRQPRPGPDWRKAPDPDSIWRMNHPPRCDILNIQTFVILMIFY